MLDCAADGIGQNTSYTVGDFASHLGPISKRDLVCCLFMYVAQHCIMFTFFLLTNLSHLPDVRGDKQEKLVYSLILFMVHAGSQYG